MSHSVSQHRVRREIWRLIGRLAFNRITVVGHKCLSLSGATLYVVTHRNGALDAAPYALAVPSAIPLVSAQLHRTVLGRCLFPGIPIARAKDRNRGIEVDNANAIAHCIDVLKEGGQLLVMPEGTSTLGPRPLPLQRGAARIAYAAVNAGVALTIVPLGVHYEDPTVWQSRVEVLVGDAVPPQPGDDVAAIHNLITHGLGAVGASFASDDVQRNVEALAYAATLGTRASYALSLKHLEQVAPEMLAEIVAPLASIKRKTRLCLHQGVPLITVLPWPLYALYWLLLAPLVLGFAVLNAPVLAGGFIASRTLPDAPNVIAFWRMVVGLSVGLVWAVLVSASLLFVSGFVGLALYWGFTIAGIGAWYRFRKLSVALCNSLFHPGTRSALLQAFQGLKNRMPHDRTL